VISQSVDRARACVRVCVWGGWGGGLPHAFFMTSHEARYPCISPSYKSFHQASPKLIEQLRSVLSSHVWVCVICSHLTKELVRVSHHVMSSGTPHIFTKPHKSFTKQLVFVLFRKPLKKNYQAAASLLDAAWPRVALLRGDFFGVALH
jgi:hypothetical protein